MKAMCLLATLAIAGVGFMACSDDEGQPLVRHTVTFEGPAYEALVDSPQYGGKLIYSAQPYTWADEATTLTGEVVKDDWTAWGGGWGWKRGFALSHYVDADAAVSYDRQLAVPAAPKSGRVFAVCFDDSSRVGFADGVARRIVSLDVCPTTYLLNDLRRHKDEADYSFCVRANGLPVYTYDAQHQVEGWQTVTLDAPASELVFTFEGTDRTEWGLTTPKYIAVDNIVVVENYE